MNRYGPLVTRPPAVGLAAIATGVLIGGLALVAAGLVAGAAAYRWISRAESGLSR